MLALFPLLSNRNIPLSIALISPLPIVLPYIQSAFTRKVMGKALETFDFIKLLH